MNNQDPYFKKQITQKFKNQEFKFDVPHEVFSTFKIDIGTVLLLKNLLKQNIEPKKVLDLGCGYGPIGIVVAKMFPSVKKVTMVDKDLLAVKYAKYNSKLNDVYEKTNIFGSVGLEEVKEKDFDLILSNVPAKIGDRAIEKEFILEPLSRLGKDGTFWIVVVSGLNRLIPRLCKRNNIENKQIVKRHGHTVYRIG